MPNNANERHVGHKVQLWVPDALYAALKARAMRHDTSLAEELRKAASAGLDPLKAREADKRLDPYLNLAPSPENARRGLYARFQASCSWGGRLCRERTLTPALSWEARDRG